MGKKDSSIYYDLMVTYDIDGSSKSKGYVEIGMFVHDYKNGHLPSEASNIRAAFNMNESDVRSFKSFEELFEVCQSMAILKDELRNDMMKYFSDVKSPRSTKSRINKKHNKKISKMKKKSRQINYKRHK